jgi:hypothetical protein
LNFGNAPFRVHPGFGFNHHHRRYGNVTPFYGGYYGGGYYLPYAYGYPMDVVEPGVDDTLEQDYATGPTILDRSGYPPDYAAHRAQEDYRAELQSRQRDDLDAQQPAQPAPQEVAAQPATVLVFKDGHKVEIGNYALVGGTLYDLSDGRAKKIALASLDLPATVKQNDERGVDFRLPAGTKLN